MAENRSDERKNSTRVPDSASGLDAIAAAARRAGKGPPPVHLWNPPHCGDIGLRIAGDGTWYYQNSPIGRKSLVQLFASVLRKDDDEHVLVTPVEKISIAVDDAPFLAVEMQRTGNGENQVLAFRTNVDDWVEAGPEHEIRFDHGPAQGLKPYIRVRGQLWALVSRPLFYDLVEAGETRNSDAGEVFGVASNGAFFVMARAGEIDL